MSNIAESDFSESDDDDTGVFDVEKIIDHVVVDDKETFYRVRWKGYGADSDTWEPKENLLTCEELLNTYIEREIESKKNPSTSKPKVITIEDNSSSDETVLPVIKPKRGRPFNSKNKRGRGRGRGRGWGRGRGRGRGVTRVVRQRPSSSESSSSSSSSSGSDEPQVKDPFWENLQQGKIDVFSGDLYSKIKRRREPRSEDLSAFEIPPEIVVKKPPITKRRVISLQDEATKVNTTKTNIDDDSSSSSEEEDDSSTTISVDVNTDNFRFLDKENVNSNAKKITEQKGVDISSICFKTFEGQEDVVNKGNDETLTKDESDAENTETTEDLPPFENLDLEMEVIPKIAPIVRLTDIIRTENTSERDSTTTEDNLQENDNEKNKMDEDFVISSDENEAEKNQKKKTKKERSENVKKRVTLKDKIENLLSKNVEPQDKEQKEIFQTIQQRLNIPEKKNEDSIFEQFGEEKKLDKESNNTKASDTSTKSLKISTKSSEILLKPKDKARKTSSEKKKSPPSSTSSRMSGMSMFDHLEEQLRNSPQDEIKQNIDQPPQPSRSLTPKPIRVEKNIPDISELMALKVTFELDEITLKQIEQHHEAGEPPCRVEKEISNSEFRQFIRNNNYEMVYEILKSKRTMYNLEHQDSMWMTQIMIAAAAGCSEIVKVLAHYGARINARTKNNSSALMYAAEKGHYLTTRILLMYGAYVNMQTNIGETALTKAVKYGHIDVVRCLLLAGADPSLKSTQGVNALNMEGVVPSACVALARKHKCNVDNAVSSCIQSSLQMLGLKILGPPTFALRSYNVRENSLIQFNFNYHMQDVPPNQGLVLFVVHGMIGSGLMVKCRLRGPCHVVAVTMNNKVMEPLLPTKESDKYSHFMTNLQWKTGPNSIKVFLSQDGLSKEKIYLIAHRIGFG